MIKLDVTLDESKALAYTAGFILRVIEAPDQGAAGLGAVVRKVGARLAKQEFQQLALKLATVPQESLRLETLTAYTIAIFVEAAGRDFEEDFLDWRAFRHGQPDLPVTGFRPLADIWDRCFRAMLENPDRVELGPYQTSWSSARLRLLRAVGAGKPSLLRDALGREDALRSLMEPLLRARLERRCAIIAEWRQLAIAAVDSGSTHCPTCLSQLRAGSPLCVGCGEAFPSRLPDPARGFGPEDAHKASTAMLMCGLLEEFVPSKDLDLPHGKCVNCLLPVVAPSAGQMCPTCGQLQVSLSGLLADEAWVDSVITARWTRIAYNLAIGMPALRTYGATDLTDDDQVKAAHARKWQEARHHLEQLAKNTQELRALHKMAGLE